MDKSDFADTTLNLLCEYVGEDKVFDVLVRRWGIEDLFDILSKLMAQKRQMEEVRQADGDE